MKSGDAGFTAGRVIRADKNASSNDNFHVVGLYLAAGDEDAADEIEITKAGKITATAHGFTIGEPIFLGANGAIIQAASFSNDEGEAQKQLGIVKDADTIEVQIMQAFIA
jgi:hypothetical protein